MSKIFRKKFNLCFPSSTNPSLIYDHLPDDDDDDCSKPLTDTDILSSSTSSSSSSSSSSSNNQAPDFAAAFASQRFFFSSPGRSNSIIESPDTTPPEPPLDGGVAVKKYSPDPYTDFRCSMQEMIEAQRLRDVKTDLEFLHELVLRLMSMNSKQTHKFIITAFADILISLLSK